MKEWSEANKYHSFNPIKGLTYYQNYQRILAWMDGNGKLPPPIECNLDPYAGCNLFCYFCVTQRYLRTKPEEVGPMRILPSEYVYRLIDFLATWGVKGFCVSGGGEPTLHQGFPGWIEHAVSQGMQGAVFTNGTRMNEDIAHSLLFCQFVTISVNASDSETYQRIMGVDAFGRLNDNMHFLTKLKNSSKAFLCARMLVLPENWQQIHQVCRWAKNVGLSGFSVRPVDFEREDIPGHKKLDLPVKAISEQFARCHEEETSDFKVFTVTHKFDPEFHVKHDFNKCLATPLLIPILQDGNAYLCVDTKMDAKYRLGSCYPDPEKILGWWGSDAHRDLIRKVDISKCSRCTFSQYNRQMEAVREDSMMVSFP